ncbi:MAG: hypothetical protein ACYSTY_05945 [Planctomycetota bacterium]|jgi:hypothetical protein
MPDRTSEKAVRSDAKDKFGYKPTGQRGYQPQSAGSVDPTKLTPPTGGSSVQPPPPQASEPKKPD